MSVSRTNQALYFAKQALSEASSAEGQQDIRRHQEAALFHINSALGAFCQEVVLQYGLPPFRVVSDLLSQAQLPQELKELAIMLETKDSWLSQLTTQYQRVLTQGLGEPSKNTALIVSQSDFSVLYRNYLIELENLIQRMREQYLEC